MALAGSFGAAHDAEAQAGKGLDASAFADILPPDLAGGCGDFGGTPGCLWSDAGTTQGYNITRLDPSGKSWAYDITKLFAIDFARDCYGASVAFANTITVPHNWGAGPFPENSAEAAPDPETVRTARALAPALDKKLKDIPCGGTRLTPVVCKQQPPDSEQVDKTLEFSGKFLQAYVEAPAPWWPPPPQIPAGYVPNFSAWTIAARLAKAQWDQVEAVLTAHNRGLLEVSKAQNQRIKAYAHWVVWLMRRGDVFDQAAYDDFLKENPKPGYPLVGPDAKSYYAANFVDPPKDLRFIYDKSPQEIWQEERWNALIANLKDAVVVVPLGVVDVYLTKGFLVSLYYSHRAFEENPDSPAFLLPVAINIALLTPAGPPLLFAWALYNEISEFQELSFPEHLGNMLAIGASGYQMVTAARRPPAASLPAIEKGIDEGFINPALKNELGGRTFQELGERRIDGSNQYQKVRFGVVGPLEGERDASGNLIGNGRQRPNEPYEIMEAEFRVVDGPDGARYFTFNPDGSLKDPVFFLGQAGYHAWKHLTELNAGLPTGETSYRTVFKGMEYDGELAGIEVMLRDPKVPIAKANTRFLGWMKDLTSAEYRPYLVHMVKTKDPAFPNQPTERWDAWGHYFGVKSKCTGKLEVIRFAVSEDQKVVGGFRLMEKRISPAGDKRAEYGGLQTMIKQGLPWWLYTNLNVASFLQ
jgi:hypothetical protein